MTSAPIKIKYSLTLTAEGEAPETICGEGEQIEREGKTLIKLDDRRFQIEKERVLIRQGYQLDLDKHKETQLLYPTPYGTLSMKVRVKQLKISDGAIYAIYALYTGGQLLHYVEMNLKTERI